MPHGVLPTVCAGRASPGLGADITEGSGRREGAAFSLALYINQTTDDEGNRRMKKATEELIDLTIAHKGRFFLPYQLYYSRDQLQRSYPQINGFFAAKRKYDPVELFTNTFYQKYAS